MLWSITRSRLAARAPLTTTTTAILMATRNASAKAGKAPPPPKPSSSIMLVSPTNQLLLLHRVQTASAFPSSHVFPGGNISAFHETVPAIDAPDRHTDSEAYRLAAVRETFEESGILLARKAGSPVGSPLLELSDEVREEARKLTHGNKVKFVDWLASVGGEPDVERLLPFTRWITPTNVPKRFTTQMYVYLLPLESKAGAARDTESVIPTPTHDGGLEHTAVAFDDVKDWLARAASGDIILYPPQMYLLKLLGEFLTGPGDYAAQREALKAFLNKVPTGNPAHPTANIPWGDKVISPIPLNVERADGRRILQLHSPGPELKGSNRGGDYDRVVLVNFTPQGARGVEVVPREEVEGGKDKAKL